VDGEKILTLESNSVCGKTLSDRHEKAIREAAESLLAFIGKDGYATFAPETEQ
jgi:hypothetical protein